MNVKLVIYILLIIIIGYLIFNKKQEHQSGALLQLYAKGPQDDYLTYPNFYLPPYYGYGYGYGYGYNNHFMWNMPTRFNRNQASYLWLTPERYDLF
jgi:hypothetical protein